MPTSYAVIVIGGGHAGVEAARAASAVLEPAGGRVALVTMDPSKIGVMSCNPAIGGLAKGQMVREIDALGGIMGRAIDATGIMFKMLNRSKGPAVRGPRAQADKYAYRAEVQRLVAAIDNLDVIAAPVIDVVVDDGRAVGVLVPENANIAHADPRAIDTHLAGDGISPPIYPASTPPEDGATRVLQCDAVVLTTGTFMRGLMHTGERQTPGGRADEGAAVGISCALTRLGFELGRQKTGTPPRLDLETIDWEALTPQSGDDMPVPFSDLDPATLPGGRFPRLEQVQCRMTATTADVHDVIRANLDRAPMYSGAIDAECGPRYCPSIEDKVVRFADRDAHHVFLEPESLHTNEVYCNGISTSLPVDVQEQLVSRMPGCANARVLRWGYAVEYDMVWPHQIDATAMTKPVRGLFLAGQINGTSGYEEAGGQGLVAGLNAARLSRDEDLVRLGRDRAYVGVMLDDLVTRAPREPYRMFTSRAEHRLLLRADNADERLTALGRELGLVDDERWRTWTERSARLDTLREAIATTQVSGAPLAKVIRRQGTTLDDVAAHLPPQTRRDDLDRIVTEVRYDGYVRRQAAEIRRQRTAERQTIPEWLVAADVPGLRAEAAEVLDRMRPATMGQAARLPGVNPADLTLLAVAIRRGRAKRAS